MIPSTLDCNKDEVRRKNRKRKMIGWDLVEREVRHTETKIETESDWGIENV